MAQAESIGDGIRKPDTAAGRRTREDIWQDLVDSAGNDVNKRRYREAEQTLEQALTIAEMAWPNGGRHCETAVRLADVCVMLSLEGRAEALYRQALLAGSASQDGAGPATIQAVSGLGRLYLLRDEIDKADPLIRHSLQLGRAAYGAGFTSVPVFLNLAMLNATAQRDGEARRMFDLAVEALEHSGRDDVVEAIAAYDNYALFNISRGNLDQAEQRFRRALILRQESVGPVHPVYAVGLVNLGRLQFRRGTLDEAEALMAQAYDVFEGKRLVSYSGHLPVYHHLALLAQLGGRADEATAFCASMRGLADADMEEYEPALAAALHVEARINLDRRQYRDAEINFQQALQIAENASPVHRRFTAGILTILLDDLAAMYREAGKAEEARRLSDRALEVAGALDWSLGRRVFTAG